MQPPIKSTEPLNGGVVMRRILKMSENSIQSRSAIVCFGLLCVLILFLSATTANATAPPPVPPIVLSQVTWLNTLQGGGAFSGGNPAGSSFAVNSDGDIIVSNTYGDKILLINGQTGAVSTLATWSNMNPGGVTIDSLNNLYISALYDPTVIKIPYVNRTYAAITTTPSPTCAGGAVTTDTAPCVLQGLTVSANGWWFGTVSMAFDSAGDLFFVTADKVQQNASYQEIGPSNGGNQIFECTASCLATGSGAVLLYQEPTNASASLTSGQLMVGGLAVDPWGNVFFTDASFPYISTTTPTSFNTSEVLLSNLNELPTSAGAGYGGATTGYAAAPTVLYTETDTPPSNYDDVTDAVAVDGKGTVYFSSPSNGVFAFPNTGGTIPLTSGQPTNLYGVSPQGAKMLTADIKGNLDFVFYGTAISSGGMDTVGRISLGSISGAATAVGVQGSMSNVSAVVNDGAATPALTFVASSGGQAIPGSNVSATAGTSSALATGTAFPVTITYKTGDVGEQTAVLTATETVNSTTGSAAIYTVGNGPMLTLDPGVLTTYTSGSFNAPTWVTLDQSGDMFIVDGGMEAIFEIDSGSTTPVSVGSGFTSPTGIVTDANGNLYIADDVLNEIFEVPNTKTTGGFTAGTQTTVVSSSVKFGGAVLNGSARLAIGPDGVLYIGDTGNNRIVTYNPSNGDTGVFATGLNGPQGIAVDGAGNVYVANWNGGDVLVYSGGGVVTTLSSIPGVTSPDGIAVDASGSVLVSDSGNGNIVRIPKESGVLTVADAITIENTGYAAGIALDQSGNLYVADRTAPAVYGIQRTAASFTFGTTNDGDTSAAQTLYAENAGNTAITLGNPFATGLTGPFIDPVAVTPCTDGLSGPAGAVCELSVTFAPTGTMSGVQSGSFTLNSNAVKLATATVNLTGTAHAAVVKTAQTISFTSPTTLTYAYPAGPLTVAASSTSGLTVTLSIDGASTANAGSLSGGQLTINSPGTIIIDANQAGDSTYAAAPQVQLTITVTGTANIITFPNPGAQTMTSSLTLTATASSGLAVSYTSNSTGICTVGATTGVVSFVSAGTCSITAAQAGNSTYAAATSVTDTFAVSLATQTITFTNPSAQTMTSTLTLAATADSGLAVSYTSNSTGICTVGVATGVVSFVSAGTCSITAAQAGNSTYAAATSVTDTFAVSLATQTITFTNPGAQTMTSTLTLAATASSSLAVSYTSNSTGVCTVGAATGVVSFVSAGTCSITAAQAGNSSYAAATSVTDTFAVSLTSQTITYTPSVTTYSYSAGTFTLSGATASSSLAITYSSTTPAVCTVSGTTATIVTFGTCTVQAAQAGNVDYAAATSVTASYTITSLGTAGTPSASVASGGTVYTTGSTPITLTSSTAGVSIYYTLTSGATGTAPTTSSTPYTNAGVAIPAVGTWTLEAIAVEAGYTPSTVANVTFTVSSIPPNFGLTISIPSVILTNGQGSANDTITVTPTGGFNAAVTFACTQVPAGVSCSFSPSTITPSGGPASTTLTLISSTAISSLHRNSNPLVPTGATLAAALCFFGFRRRRNLKLVLLLAVSFVGLGLSTGCSHHFYGSPTPPITEMVQVTATSGTLVQTANFQVTLVSPSQQ